MMGTMQPRHWGTLQGLEAQQLYGRRAAATEKRAVAGEKRAEAGEARDIAGEARAVTTAAEISKGRKLDIEAKEVGLKAQQIQLQKMEREAESRGNRVDRLANYTAKKWVLDEYSGQQVAVPGQVYEVYQEVDEFGNPVLDESGRPITKYYPIEVDGGAEPEPLEADGEDIGAAYIAAAKRGGELGINIGKVAPDLADPILGAAEEMKMRIPQYWEKLTQAQKQQAATARATAKMRGEPTSTQESIERAQRLAQLKRMQEALPMGQIMPWMGRGLAEQLGPWKDWLLDLAMEQ